MTDLPLRDKVAGAVAVLLMAAAIVGMASSNNDTPAPPPTTVDADVRRCSAQADDTMRQFPGVYASEAEYVAYCVATTGRP